MQGYIAAIGLAFGAGGTLHAGDLAHGTFAALLGPVDDGIVAAHQRGKGFAVALAAIGVQHHFAAAGAGLIGIFRHQSGQPVRQFRHEPRQPPQLYAGREVPASQCRRAFLHGADHSFRNGGTA